MPLTPLSTSPAESDYTPLSAHQEQTPQTFFAEKPVLHYHSPAATLKLDKSEFLAREELRALGNESESDEEGLTSVTGADVWVGSADLRLWSPSKTAGVLVPYPSITVHAQIGASVLLEINLSDANTTPEDEIEHLTLRILPDPATTEAAADPTAELYKAIGACQELNPDPMDRDSDEEGGAAFDETAPGSTGWITSENMADFVDEDGNFKMPEGTEVTGDGDGEPLGEGAGRVRRAEEVGGGAEVDGDGEEGKGKWQRTG